MTQHLGTRFRVHAREAQIKFAMNVVRKAPRAGAATVLVIDDWSEAHRHASIHHAIARGRRIDETEVKEVGRLWKENLPRLQENQRLYLVTRERKDTLVRKMGLLRQEGKVVRRVGAIRLLTANQVKEQLALRVFLGCPVTGKPIEVQRSGKKEVLTGFLKLIVQAELEARQRAKGPDGYSTDEEVTRLRGLGLGPKQKQAAGGATRRPKPARARQQQGKQGGEQRSHPKRGRARDDDANSDGASDADADSSDESDSADDEPEDKSEDELDPDLAAALQADDVYKMQKLERVREAEEGGREFYVKWEGYHRGWNTWEPEANLILFNPEMVRRFDVRHGVKAAPKPAAPKPAAPIPKPA